jgi:predicted PurR-regulated permease PerM
MSTNYRRWVYALVVLLTVIAALYISGWLLQIAQAGSNVIALYFFAWLIQFFFTPFVDLLSRQGMPRMLAVSFVYLAVGLGIALTIYATVPGAVTQGQRLSVQLANPKTYQPISNLTRDLETFAETRLHVPRSQIELFTKNYSVRLQKGAFTAGTQLEHLINSHLTASNISNSATAILGFLNVLNTFFLNLIIVLILAFYMMLDGHKLVREALAYFPDAADEVMESVHQIINRKFGGYIRSQFILALSYGLLTYIISVGFDVSYTILIALVSALAMLVPFIGAFAAVVPPLLGFVLVHATDHSFPLVRFILLFVFLAVAQHIVLNLLAPRVMGNALGMHPLLVMLGLLVGAALGGLWGAIFGVPILGVLLDVIDLAYRRVMERRYGFHPRSPQELPPDLLPEIPLGRRPVRRRSTPPTTPDEQEPAARRARHLTAYLPHVHSPSKLKKGQRRGLRIITRTEKPTK